MPAAGPRRSDRFVPGAGPLPCHLMLVGEGPGRHEDRVGRPFVGDSGDLLDDLLRHAGLRRQAAYVTNVSKCHVYNNADPLPVELAADRPILEAEIDACQPSTVVALGRTALRTFRPDLDVEQAHGYPHAVPGRPFTLFPCYHPAAGLHDTDRLAQVYWDFERLGQYLRGQIPIHAPRPYDIDLRQGVPYASDPLVVGLDTESNWDGSPWCHTFAIDDRRGYFQLADDPGIATFRDWLLTPRRDGQQRLLLVHNVLHDLEVYRQLGIDLAPYLHADGPIRLVDTMVWAYHDGIHPQGLKALAYRLLQVEMASYSDMVEPARQAKALQYLQLVECLAPTYPPPAEEVVLGADGAPRIKKPRTLYSRVAKILKDHQARGSIVDDPDLGVDLPKRWAAIEPALRAPAEDHLGLLPRADLRDIPRPDALRYACQDAVAALGIGLHFLETNTAHALDRVDRIDHGKIPMVATMQRTGLPADRAHFERLSQEMTLGQARCRSQLQTLLGRRLNPNSAPQVAEVVYDQLGLPIVKRTPTGAPSVSKKVLQVHRDQIEVDLIVTDKEMGKIKDAFSGPISRWISPSGRLTFNLRITRTKTGRLAANSPNVLAIPARTALGKRVKAGFIAAPGMTLAAWDQSQIEMRVCADLSQDAALLQAYREGIDIHTQTAARVYGVAPENVTKEWRTACKSTGFGIIMGITGRGLADQMRLYRLAGWSVEDCDRLIREWLKIHPGVADFQARCKVEARRTGEVRSKYGRRFLLPGITCSVSRVAEEAARQAHALPVQATAQEIMGMGMAWLDREGLPRLRAEGIEATPLLQTHDELMLEIPEGAFERVHPVMIHALTQVASLSVPIEASGSCARCWADLEK